MKFSNFSIFLDIFAKKMFKFKNLYFYKHRHFYLIIFIMPLLAYPLDINYKLLVNRLIPQWCGT